MQVDLGIAEPGYARNHRPQFQAEFSVAEEKSHGPRPGLPSVPLTTPPTSPSNPPTVVYAAPRSGGGAGVVLGVFAALMLAALVAGGSFIFGLVGLILIVEAWSSAIRRRLSP